MGGGQKRPGIKQETLKNSPRGVYSTVEGNFFNLWNNNSNKTNLTECQKAHLKLIPAKFKSYVFRIVMLSF